MLGVPILPRRIAPELAPRTASPSLRKGNPGRGIGSSLQALIFEAATVPDVDALLAKGEGYERASADTRRKWARSARRRTAYLQLA